MSRILGGSLRHLTDDRVNRPAAWSPDGESVVYSKPAESIYVVRSDGTTAQKLRP